MRAAIREGHKVSFLELFFDLVLVLALTQATALMAAEPTWAGLGKGVLVIAVMWWAWVGYTWLTSVVDPESAAVRVVIAIAMAGLLVCGLCIPTVFNDSGLLFAVAYGVVRFGQIALFWIASRSAGDANLARSVSGLAVGTLISVSLLAGASFLDGWAQGGLWALALVLDMAGPYLFGSEGWRLEPKHFAERHGLILIIALGESIVAVGAGASGVDLGPGEITAAVLAMAVTFAMWWMYFDVVVLVAERRLETATKGKEQNEIARDSFSYLHLPMVAGIVLVALGFKKTIGHVDDPLKLVPSVAMYGGLAMYLLAHVAFRWRNVHRFSTQRVVVALLALALIPVGKSEPALLSLALLAALAVLLVAYETIRFRELRREMRAKLLAH